MDSFPILDIRTGLYTKIKMSDLGKDTKVLRHSDSGYSHFSSKQIPYVFVRDFSIPVLVLHVVHFSCLKMQIISTSN